MPGKDLAPRPPAQVLAANAEPPWDRQETALKSEAAYRRIARWACRDRHVSVPLAVPLVLWPAGVAAHGFGAKWYVLVAGIITSTLIWVFAPHKWDRAREQMYARISVIAASCWLFAASLLGPLSNLITAVILATLLLAGSIAWGIPWWHHKRPRGRKRREKTIARWDGWWQPHAWGNWHLGGSRVIDVAEVGAYTTRVRVQGVPGRHSYDSFRRVLPLIESSLEGFADAGMVRVEKVKGNPSQCDCFFKRENPLAGIVEFDLALAPRSVHDLSVLGLTETGQWKMVVQRVNAFIIGKTRSGKSNHLLVRLVQLTGCADDRQIVIDLKGGRSARPVLAAGAAEYVITEVDEARLYLRMLIAEIHARAKGAYVGEEEQLRATVEIPAIHTLIDETHGLTSVRNGDRECTALLATATSEGSGLEVYEEVYTQFGSLEESVGTDQTRGNLALRVCYAVEEARHGSYVIPEYNKLDASKLEQQGTCYVKDGPEVHPEQVRAPKMSHALFRRIATQNAAMLKDRPPLRLYCGDQMSPAGMTWQEWWDRRWLRLDPAFHSISPQYREAAERYAAPAPPQDTAIAAAAMPPAEPVPSPVPGEGTAASAAARITAELAAIPQIPDGFRPPKVRLSEVIAGNRDRFAALLQGAPAEGISPKQLMEGSGMASTWVHGMLRDLVECNAVTQPGRGRYVSLPGAVIADEIARIRDGYDHLADEARKMAEAGAA